MSNPQPSTRIPQLFRTLAGLTVGMLIAFALVIAVELVSAVVHPLPPDFAGTQEEMCAHVARYPQWALALVVPAWAFTALAATWTAKRIGAFPAGFLIGLLLTIAVLSNVSMLPYPVWFKIAAVIAVVGAVVAACRSRR